MTMLFTQYMTRFIIKPAVGKHQFIVSASKPAEKVTEAMHEEGSLGRTTPAGEPAPETTAASCMPGSAAAIAVGDDMLL